MNTIPLDTHDPHLFALLDELIHHYKIDTLPQEEQTLFYLEFARVIRLRCENVKATNPPHISEGEILLREIETVATKMLAATV
ncbi:MAG: hypothetical protein Q8L37_06560 [Candidatus Gottesmanbacteria bacterium]|nr:hypothetical protein [Candidatus Gottesmanbacteria bacterium]